MLLLKIFMCRVSALIVTALIVPATLISAASAGAGLQTAQAKAKTIEIPFKSHDGYPMFGKLTIPDSPGGHPVVIYVQTAEGMTVDMKRPKPGGGTFNYFDLYAEKLPEMNVAFFRYEGRGASMGDQPPRYEKFNQDIYNTSTLENKVRDILSVVEVVKKQPGIDTSQIFLMGASEGTLLAAEAASRAPGQIKGLILYGVMSGNMRETFRFIVTDGAFILYRKVFDADKDGKISKAEFEADPYKYRENVFKNAGFENFDRNGDGFWTGDEMKLLSKVYLDAIDSDNFEVLDRWATGSAGVTTPKGWFKDHFAHPAIWTFLSKLDISIGLFQGDADLSTSGEGVRKMEELAKKAGKSNMHFYYFERLDHSLGIISYFVRGTLPDGHKAIFEYINNQVGKKQP
jgi:pimeloyl-ACP methyl ester carboxylesterase